MAEDTTALDLPAEQALVALSGMTKTLTPEQPCS